MSDMELQWEVCKEVKVLKLWKAEAPDKWPQVVILKLTRDQFKQLKGNAVVFAREHELYPDQPVSRMLGCMELASEDESSAAAEGTSEWTVIIYHGKTSRAFYLACSDNWTATEPESISKSNN